MERVVSWDEARAEVQRLRGSLCIGGWEYKDNQAGLEGVRHVMQYAPEKWAELTRDRLNTNRPLAYALAVVRRKRYEHPWWKKLLWIAPPTFDDFYQQAYAEMRAKQSSDMHLLCRG